MLIGTTTWPLKVILNSHHKDGVVGGGVRQGVGAAEEVVDEVV